METQKIFSIIIVAIFLASLGIFISLSSISESSQQTGINGTNETNATILIELFVYSGVCETCDDAEDRLNNDIIPVYGDNITIDTLPVDYTEQYKENYEKFQKYGFTLTPGIVVKNISGVDNNISILDYDSIINIGDRLLEKAVEMRLANKTIVPQVNDTNTSAGMILDTPFGEIDLSDYSLPVLTAVLGAIDSVNPCSFFVLLFLLSILTYTKSRKRMILIGGIFIFFSGFIYFLLMAAILNVILISAQQLIIAMIAGVIAIIFGALNIKDFFFFKKGPSASIPDSQKPRLYKQMRKLVKITSIPSLIVGTVVLAVSANTVELLCSFNLPLIYTTILTSYDLSSFEYYLYIFAYNLVYIIPLLIIVSAVVITMGRWKLSEFQGRMLKLFSGIMIFSLGEILLLSPNLLSNFFIAIAILIFSLMVTFVVYFISKIIEKDKSDKTI